jgi:hypothetical protein
MDSQQQPPRSSPPTYHAYLLRLWCEGDGQRWRASLQSTTTEQTQHFPHAEALLGFLCRQMGITVSVVSAHDDTPQKKCE